MKMKKTLPVGVENFPDVVRNNCYYVDKTAFIKALMTSGNKVQLIRVLDGLEKRFSWT